MDEINKAINIAIGKYKEEFGEDAKLENGEEFATVFKNCVLIISMEMGELKIKVIGGKPYEVDMDLDIFESEG